jgi:hypothetical protein
MLPAVYANAIYIKMISHLFLRFKNDPQLLFDVFMRNHLNLKLSNSNDTQSRPTRHVLWDSYQKRLIGRDFETAYPLKKQLLVNSYSLNIKIYRNIFI